MALRFTIIDQFGNYSPIDEPVGWDAINLHYIRHKDWHGFIDTVDDTMGSLQFFGYGRDILRAAFASYGVEAQCGFLVEFQCADNDSWDTIYKGQFSFYKYKEVEGLNGCHVECSVESDTNVMTLKNRYEQKVDLDNLLAFQATGSGQIQAISTTVLYPPDPNIDTVNSGDTYLIPTPPLGQTNHWGDSPGHIAVRTDGGWTYASPAPNQQLIDLSTHQAYIYQSGSWQSLAPSLTHYSPALGGEILLPPKTIRLVTSANVNSSAGTPTPDTANTGNKHFTGGSTFRIENDNQTSHCIQLSWIDGLTSEGVKSFAGADAQVWDGKNLTSTGSHTNLDDGGDGPSPVFTYTPDAHFTAPQVMIDVKITGTISAYDSSNNSSQPIQVKSVTAMLCQGPNSYQDAMQNGLIDGPSSSHTNMPEVSGTPYQTTYGATPILFTYNYSTSYPLPEGNNVYMVFQLEFENDRAGHNGMAPWLSYCELNFAGSISFSIDSTYDASASPVYLINESLSHVTEAITNNEIKVYSDFFGRTDSQPYTASADGEGSLACITNGLLIRGQTLKNGNQPPMTVSLKQLFEALNAIYNIGMNIEPDTVRGTNMNRLRIEPMSFFYSDTVIHTLDGNELILDNVDEVTIENESEKYVSIFRTGYDKWQGEQTGGLDDFMTKREYRTSLSTSNTVLEKYCHFLGSSYAIETTRRQSGLNTQDWRFDNEIFIICLKRDIRRAATLGTVTVQQFQYFDDLGNVLRTFYKIVNIAITDHGMGYTSPPVITVNDSAGHHIANCYTSLTPDGQIAAIYYSTAQFSTALTGLTATIPAPTAPSAGGGAAIGAVSLNGDGTIASISVSAGGSGYTVPPIVYIPPPSGGGTEATALAFLTAGSVSSITITNPGTGYYSATSAYFTPAIVQDLRVEQYAIQSGSSHIVDPNSLYNYRISPLRNAMRWVRSIFQSYAHWLGGRLYYVSGEANILASGQYAGAAAPVIENAAMPENADISYSNFAVAADYYPLFGNQLVKFTYPLSYRDWKAITLNPCGLIKYNVNSGAYQYGWIDELKYSPFNGTAEFTLKRKL